MNIPKNLLAIDTATEQCSVALVTERSTRTRCVATARGHADLILTLIDSVLKEGQLDISQVDALAFGRGPGSFTGVRIAVSVAQGLALARRLPVVGISNLAAVAQQSANMQNAKEGARILVCMDARMQEVYWATYRVRDNGLVVLEAEEQVSPPLSVDIDVHAISFAVGTGWRAYPALRDRYSSLHIEDDLLPRAVEIAQLAASEFVLGQGVSAAAAQPVYLRDRVVSSQR